MMSLITSKAQLLYYYITSQPQFLAKRTKAHTYTLLNNGMLFNIFFLITRRIITITRLLRFCVMKNIDTYNRPFSNSTEYLINFNNSSFIKILRQGSS